MTHHIHIYMPAAKTRDEQAHDPKNGQFTAGSGGGGASGASKFHHPDGTPKLRGGDWKGSVSSAKSIVEQMRKEGYSDKNISGRLYNTHQNVPKRHFSRFLTELGVAHNAAEFAVKDK